MTDSRPHGTDRADGFGFWNEKEPVRRPFLTFAGRVLPGIASVQKQVSPYAAGWRRHNAEVVDGPTPLWVALGDSMTLGVGASAYDFGWVGRLQGRLAAAGHEFAVVNLGVSGARTVDLLERQLPALAQLDAALVTVMIGSNDVIRRRYRRGLPERFAAILRQLPAGAVVTTLPNPSATAGEVNRLIQQAAPERGLVVVEMRDPRTASWRGKLAADHFHPNDAGYEAIARVIEDAVLPRLPRLPGALG